jgi:hypothetical protein
MLRTAHSHYPHLRVLLTSAATLLAADTPADGGVYTYRTLPSFVSGQAE